MNRLSVLSLLILTIFHEGHTAVGDNLSFSLSGSSSKSYSKFITSLRNALPNAGKVYNIPLLLPTLKGSARYTLMKLSNYEEKTITVAIDVTNVYIMGYLVNTTSYFFNEPAAQLASEFVFQDTKHILLPYSGNYQKLQIAADKDRDSIPLGFLALDTAISALYHYDTKAAPAAFLVLIQTTAEASRFKYIEKQIIDRIGRNEVPSLAAISLENEWSLLSKQIQIANSNNGTFQTPVKLINDKGLSVEVTNVSSLVVTNNIKLLLNKQNVATFKPQAITIP
ncbi:putative ribosome-inactivating protein [Cucurbita pepo subsp. pepo]|uniref:putative ribosome-inactivating protein n=1 Tax=Cucurbita pepo subsp. pepo TaxID=3664 RepID=UPI000C9D7A35|nr:putative ribosome-inactivating protein [Cucurbita pepo subsp. pepo]